MLLTYYMNKAFFCLHLSPARAFKYVYIKCEKPNSIDWHFCEIIVYRSLFSTWIKAINSYKLKYSSIISLAGREENARMNGDFCSIFYRHIEKRKYSSLIFEFRSSKLETGFQCMFFAFDISKKKNFTKLHVM